MEWLDLLRGYSEALRQHVSWLERGCVGEAPAPLNPNGARGPVPPELRGYVMELVAQTGRVEAAIAEQLSTLRLQAGHTAPVRVRQDERPVPRYLDAMG